MDKNYIQHHGTKGMKWGIRRFQNKDGSLTPAGKRRRAKTENYHDDYKKAHDKKSVKEMSDSELRARNNRLQMERQYTELTAKKSRGKKFINAFVGTAATLTSIGVAYGQYKKLAGTAKPAADKVLDKIGDVVLKSIDLSKPLA